MAALIWAAAFDVVVVLVWRAPDPVEWAIVSLSIAVSAGALVGLVGRRLRVGMLGRVVLLWVASFVAVAVVCGPILTVWVRVQGHPLSWSELVVGSVAGFPAVALFAHVLALPLLMGAITVEVWTREGPG